MDECCCRTEIPVMLEVSDVVREGKGQTSFFFKHPIGCKPGQFMMVWIPTTSSRAGRDSLNTLSKYDEVNYRIDRRDGGGENF